MKRLKTEVFGVKTIPTVAALAVLVLGLGALPVQAHHSFAMFDRAKDVVLNGTVREFQWTNPHSFIELEVVDAQGASQSFSIEMNSPNNLTRQGWKSSSLKTGDKVVLAMNPLRDGSRGGLFIAVQLPDGRVLGEQGKIPGSAPKAG
jgi:hypothetical protein